MKHLNSLRLALVTGAFGSAVCSAASVPAAATATGAALEEVVVTAQRVEERLQDTPLAVSAFQVADIEKLSIRNVGDAAAFTPNFMSNPGPTGGNDGYYFIRGVGQTDLNPATDPGVGTYVDGVYLGRVMGASLESSDIARIEVLRGPQGTLFGRNTMGGAINITTRDPSKQLGTEIKVAGGSRSLKQAGASLDLPVGDTAGLLVSVNYRDQDGWGHRASDGKIFDSNTSKSGRAKFKWLPTDAFTLTLTADVNKLSGTSQHTILVGFNPAAFSPFGVPIVAGMAQYLNPADPYANSSSIDPKKDYDIKGGALTLDWKLGRGNFKSITSYRKMTQFIATDYDSTPYTFYEGGFDTKQHQWSEELQLTGDTGRVKWLLGAFYYDEHNDHINLVSLGGNNGCLPFPAPPPPGGFPYPVCNFAGGQMYATPGIDSKITNHQGFALDTKAKALFGQTTIKLADQWSGTLGLRWTQETKHQDYDFYIQNTTTGVANLAGLPPAIVLMNPGNPEGRLYTLSPHNPFLSPTVPTSYNKDWSEVTPKAGLQWQPAENRLYYLSYSKGFKSGGFNGRPTPNVNTGQFGAIRPYEPEKMDAYELGAKTQFADNRVRLNLALFQSNYTGIQLLVLDPQSGFFITANAASRIRGAEVELQARPTAAFELQAGLGYTDDEYQSFTAGTGIARGMHLPLTPKYNGSVGAQYTWTLSQGDLTLRGDYAYRSEFWFEAINTAINRQGGYGLVNARLNYQFGNGRWALAAYGLNLGNKFYRTNIQDVTAALGVAFASVSPPREWGAEVRYRFGR